MAKIFLYLHHQGFDVYLSDHELTEEDRYCSYCDETDELIAVCEGNAMLKEKLQALLAQGYTLMEDRHKN